MEDAGERAAWLGWGIWGLAVAAIFLSYNALGAASVDLPSALEAWLWVPWIVVGIAGTRTVSRGLAVQPPGWRERGFWIGWLAGAGVFLAVEGALALAPSPAGPNAANLAFSGGIAAGLALLQRIRVGTEVGPGLLVGAGLIAFAYLLPHLLALEVLRSLASALAVALGFALVGAVGLAGV